MGIEPLCLRPTFSRYLAVWLVAVHLLTQLVLWQMSFQLIYKACISLLLVLYLIWQVRQHLLRSTAKAIREVLLEADGSWRLLLNGGLNLSAELLPESLVKPWLLVLNFRTGSRWSTRSLVLPPDSLPPELARRLRVHLLQHAMATEHRADSINPGR